MYPNEIGSSKPFGLFREWLIEQTRYVMLVKLDGKDSKTAVNALIKSAQNLPQELYKSLTWDRGKEMAAQNARLPYIR